MAFPNSDELEDAYQAGYLAPPGAKNPYFFGTALWIEWNFGQSVSWKIRPQPRRSVRRTVMMATLAIIIALVSIKLSYALL